MKKLLTLLVAAIMAVACCFGLVACGDGEDAQELKMPAYDARFTETIPADFKVGFIFLHDEKSTYDLNFYNAAKEAVEYFGLSDSQVFYKFNIDENEQCTDAANDLISKGCKAIFADSFGHEKLLVPLAEANPTVQFFHATGTQAAVRESLTNYHNAFASIYQGRYLAGYAAGMKLNEMIDAGKVDATKEIQVGYVGAFTYAEVISGYTSWYLGLKEAATKATNGIKMSVTFTGSWYDVDAEKTAAEKLISMGCVIVSQHADSMGAPSACEAKGVINVSYNGSTIESCPDTFLISSRIDWSYYMKTMIMNVANNKPVENDICATIEDGAVVLTNLNANVAAKNTVEELIKVRNELVAGTRQVFDVSKFTVDATKNAGATVDAQGHLTEYLADYLDNWDGQQNSTYVKDGNVIMTDAETGITYFAESYYRSAPYFDLTIDGIVLLDTKF